MLAPQLHKVIRVGRSLSVVIPATVCKQMHIERGDIMRIEVHAADELRFIKVSPEQLRARAQDMHSNSHD